ncbi:MAG: hypothetical protein ACM3NT_10035 [Methylocystaceae bacterium]
MLLPQKQKIVRTNNSNQKQTFAERIKNKYLQTGVYPFRSVSFIWRQGSNADKYSASDSLMVNLKLILENKGADHQKIGGRLFRHSVFLTGSQGAQFFSSSLEKALRLFLFEQQSTNKKNKISNTKDSSVKYYLNESTRHNVTGNKTFLYTGHRSTEQVYLPPENRMILLTEPWILDRLQQKNTRKVPVVKLPGDADSTHIIPVDFGLRSGQREPNGYGLAPAGNGILGIISRRAQTTGIIAATDAERYHSSKPDSTFTYKINHGITIKPVPLQRKRLAIPGKDTGIITPEKSSSSDYNQAVAEYYKFNNWNVPDTILRNVLPGANAGKPVSPWSVADRIYAAEQLITGKASSIIRHSVTILDKHIPPAGLSVSRDRNDSIHQLLAGKLQGADVIPANLYYRQPSSTEIRAVIGGTGFNRNKNGDHQGAATVPTEWIRQSIIRRNGNTLSGNLSASQGKENLLSGSAAAPWLYNFTAGIRWHGQGLAGVLTKKRRTPVFKGAEQPGINVQPSFRPVVKNMTIHPAPKYPKNFMSNVFAADVFQFEAQSHNPLWIPLAIGSIADRHKLIRIGLFANTQAVSAANISEEPKAVPYDLKMAKKPYWIKNQPLGQPEIEIYNQQEYKPMAKAYPQQDLTKPSDGYIQQQSLAPELGHKRKLNIDIPLASVQKRGLVQRARASWYQRGAPGSRVYQRSGITLSPRASASVNPARLTVQWPNNVWYFRNRNHPNQFNQRVVPVRNPQPVSGSQSTAAVIRRKEKTKGQSISPYLPEGRYSAARPSVDRWPTRPLSDLCGIVNKKTFMLDQRTGKKLAGWLPDLSVGLRTMPGDTGKREAPSTLKGIQYSADNLILSQAEPVRKVSSLTKRLLHPKTIPGFNLGITVLTTMIGTKNPKGMVVSANHRQLKRNHSGSWGIRDFNCNLGVGRPILTTLIQEPVTLRSQTPAEYNQDEPFPGIRAGIDRVLLSAGQLMSDVPAGFSSQVSPAAANIVASPRIDHGAYGNRFNEKVLRRTSLRTSPNRESGINRKHNGVLTSQTERQNHGRLFQNADQDIIRHRGIKDIDKRSLSYSTLGTGISFDYRRERTIPAEAKSNDRDRQNPVINTEYMMQLPEARNVEFSSTEIRKIADRVYREIEQRMKRDRQCRGF